MVSLTRVPLATWQGMSLFSPKINIIVINGWHPMSYLKESEQEWSLFLLIEANKQIYLRSFLKFLSTSTDSSTVCLIYRSISTFCLLHFNEQLDMKAKIKIIHDYDEAVDKVLMTLNIFYYRIEQNVISEKITYMLK